MRHVEIGALELVTERALDLGLVELRIFTGKRSRERWILAQIKDLLAKSRVHHSLAVVVLADLLRIVPGAIFGAEAADHVEPGAVDELIEAGGAARRRFGVGAESAFLRGLRHQQAEISRCRLARALNAVQDRWIDRVSERRVSRGGGHAPKR